MWKTVALVAGLYAILGSTAAAQEPAQPTALSAKLSIKGSRTFGALADVPLTTALLVATPRWHQIEGRAVSNRAVAVADMNVILSNLPIPCDSGYSLPSVVGDSSFIVVAGIVQPFVKNQDWTTTPIGAALSDSAQTDTRQAFERFGAIVMHNKKSVLRKEDIRAKESRLVLTRANKQWTADVVLRDSKANVEAVVPLTVCPMTNRTSNLLSTTRKEAPFGPLLGMPGVMAALMHN